MRIIPSLVLGLCAALPAQQEAAAEAAFRKGQQAQQSGDLITAAAAFQEAAELNPKNARAWHMAGFCLHGAQKLDEALKYHLKAAEFPEVAGVATYNVACVHSLKGNKDEAFKWLDKAVMRGFTDAGHLESDTDMDPIRKDPRFAKVIDTMRGVPVRLQAFQSTTDRKNARLAYFGDGGSPAQVSINYSPIPWKADYEGQIDSPAMVGKKWRFGSNFWTTLDTSVPLTFGDVTVPAGYWYLTLAHQGEQEFVLGVHDPAVARKMNLDASAAAQLPAGLEVSLHHTRKDASADELEIAIHAAPDDNSKGKLSIGFGQHRLHAKVGIELGEPKQAEKAKKKSWFW